MMRITRQAAAAQGGTVAVKVKVEGKFLEPWVGEVERECEAAESQAGVPDRVVLDLSAVTFLDAAGTERVRGLMRRGVRVAGCSRFVSELLNTYETSSRRTHDRH